MATAGFIGIGNMGGPMAANLVKAGFEVRVSDLNETLVEEAAKKGAVIAGSAQEAVKGADFVITMLPSGQIVEDLYIHKTMLLDHIHQDTLVVDCSTVAPENSRALAEAAAERGIVAVDAPVSGGVAGAEAGTLTFIVGGSDKAFERARPVLLAMGKQVLHAGGSGAGSMAKICNNLLLAIHMTGTAEALQLGVDNGLDPNVLSDIMLQSSGNNWSLEHYNPYPGVMENVPAANNYKGGFQVNLMNKDLGLALEASRNTGSATPLGELAASLFELHGRQGHGQLDFSSIQKMFGKKD